SKWPGVWNPAFGTAAPRKTIHYRAVFARRREEAVARDERLANRPCHQGGAAKRGNPDSRGRAEDDAFRKLVSEGGRLLPAESGLARREFSGVDGHANRGVDACLFQLAHLAHASDAARGGDGQ